MAKTKVENEKQASKKVEQFLVFVGEELNKRKMSVPQLAEIIGTSPQAIYTWLDRKSVMSLTAYFQILKAFDANVNLSTSTKVVKSSLNL